MILLAFATFLAGYCACFSARRRRTPPKDAFIYFNDHYTASETGAQEGEAGRVPGDVDNSPCVASEFSYLDPSGCYPMLTRQSPNSSGGSAADSGGTLPWTQLHLLFSTGQYSLLEAGCRPLVSDQLADGDFAAATDGGCRRATVENGHGLGSLNVGLEARNFEAAFSRGETTIAGFYLGLTLDVPISRVLVMRVPEKTTEPTGFPGEEAFFEALGHEFGYETTTDSQSDSTVAPSQSWPNDSYTEVSETYDGVSRPSGSTSLKVQPNVTWEVDLPPSSVNITVEPALVMTVRYMQNASGICLANISCLCSDISSPTKLVIYALDPADEVQPSAEASPTELELSRMLPVAESLNSSHVSTQQTVKDGRLVHCVSDCGVTYLRLTAGDCNHTWPQTPHPSRRNTHTAPQTVFLPFTEYFVVTMILLAFATFLAGYCACFSARRRRTPPKDAFIYFNDHYTASETGAQEGEAGRVPGDVDNSPCVASEFSYLDPSGCYPMLTRQSPSSSGGSAADSGGTLPWTQLNLLFSTGQYSLLEASCRPLVSDQLADGGFAAATDGGCRRATIENGHGLGSLNVGLEARTFEAAFSRGETTSLFSAGPCGFRRACQSPALPNLGQLTACSPRRVHLSTRTRRRAGAAVRATRSSKVSFS
nr:unnamed protein product [Spirometra erinaceieuropaei]